MVISACTSAALIVATILIVKCRTTRDWNNGNYVGGQAPRRRGRGNPGDLIATEDEGDLVRHKRIAVWHQTDITWYVVAPDLDEHAENLSARDVVSGQWSAGSLPKDGGPRPLGWRRLYRIREYPDRVAFQRHDVTEHPRCGEATPWDVLDYTSSSARSAWPSISPDGRVWQSFASGLR